MILIKFAAGFSILLFFAMVMAIISRLNSLSSQIDRISGKLSQAIKDETALNSKKVEDISKKEVSK
ncbi:MAG: hypothetical protein HQK83_01305 [Fibrobacteria bacterium]|nr:hypothetical protein [Fibrobacteria bacterium]